MTIDGETIAEHSRSGESPIVTVVTPSLNQGPFIRATIESVLAQDYPNLEYVIMDGGSTDETAAIAREYGSRLEFISEPDRGQSHAINKGFQRAKGSIVAWLNSDDVLLPGAISTAVRALNASRDAGIVYGDGYIIDREGNVSCQFPHTQAFDLWRLVHLSDYILQQSVFFRRDVLEDVGWIDESLHYGMDWDLLIRIGLKHRVAYVPDCLGCIREYPETKTASGGSERVRELHAILKKHTGLVMPPGSVVYGLDTYASIACRQVRDRVPEWARPVGDTLEKAVRFVAGTIIGRTVFHSQGLYSDGWAGKTLHYMARSGSRSIQIEGDVPEAMLQLRGQELDVEANGRHLGRYPVPAGRFGINVNIPSELSSSPLFLRIQARRSLVTTPHVWRADRRHLAYKLTGIHAD